VPRYAPLAAQEAALAIWEQVGRAGKVGENLRWLSRLHWWAGRRGDVDLERSLEVAVAAGLDDHAARAMTNLASFSVEFHDHHHAGQHLDRGLAWLHDDLERTAVEASRGFDLAVEAGHPCCGGAGVVVVARRRAPGGPGGRRGAVPVAAGR